MKITKGVYLARDSCGADVATRTCGSIDPHRRLRGAVAKWVEWIGPTGTMAPVSSIVRGAY